MANVLVATLGDSPIVVTAIVKALEEETDIAVDLLQVLYPGEATDRLIDLGYDLIADHLEGTCQVQAISLPFADANSYETSMTFLQILTGLLAGHQSTENSVYLSLAGGRKNMSALMAVVCQFFPCVQGLYHLLDRYEDNPRRRNFYSIDELFYDDDATRKAKLAPPSDQLVLVPIPYACLTNAIELQRYFKAAKRDEDFVVQTDGAADAFFSSVFGSHRPEEKLEVYLSRTAYEEYQAFDHHVQQGFDNCFQRMSNPQLLRNHEKGKFRGTFRTDCYCFKMGNTRERPFYYRQDGEVVVCRLTVHSGSYEKLIKSGEVWQRDHRKYISVRKLHSQQAILLVPLGKAPMIATQTYTLLQPEFDIAEVAVLYPERHGIIHSGARLIGNLFRRKGVSFNNRPIKGLRDVNSQKACEAYARAVERAIVTLRNDHPNKQVLLSLSGGRKGMSALTLYAAQQTGVRKVYHTLIMDPDLEEKIEHECSYDILKRDSLRRRREKLFLEAYDRDSFVLFDIPVIPLK